MQERPRPLKKEIAWCLLAEPARLEVRSTNRPAHGNSERQAGLVQHSDSARRRATDRHRACAGPGRRATFARSAMDDLARATAAVNRALRERDENTSAHSGRTCGLAMETGHACGLSPDDLATLEL